MPEPLKDEMLREAISISDYLLASASSDDTGLYWRVIESAGEEHRISETIYSGNAGILLFYVELYRHTKDPAHLDIINRIKSWLIHYCKTTPSKNPSIYTGRTGVAVALLQLYELDKNEDTRNQALAIATAAFEGEIDPDVDLLGGGAGTVIGLLFLYDHFREPWMLEKLNDQIEKILQATHFSPDEGISWASGTTCMKNLCGFSHGAGGFAFVLLAVGKYFNNPAFYWLARQAILYENAQINTSTNDWPDYRKDRGDMDKKLDYLEKGELDYFLRPVRYNFWCHGSTGIGFARLYLYAMLGDANDLKDLENVLSINKQKARIVDLSKRTYTLCHGFGADAILYMDAFRLLNDQAYLDEANQLIADAILSFKINNTYLTPLKGDYIYSLFLGAAGVGYTYLKAIDYRSSLNILAPFPERHNSLPDISAFPFLSITRGQLAGYIVRKSFPHTLSAFKNTFLPPENAFSDIDDSQFLSAFKQYIDDNIGSNEQIKGIFEIESEENRMRNGNVFYHTVRNVILARRARPFYGPDGINSGRFVLDEYVNLVKYEPPDESTSEPAPQYRYALLIASNSENPRVEIDEFCYNLFNLCKTGKSYDELFRSMTDLYNAEDREDELDAHLKAQITMSVRGRILLPVPA